MAFFLSFNLKADEKDIYGKWVQSEIQNGVIAMTSFEFVPDGTLAMKVLVQASSPKIDIDADANGTYTYEKKTITIKLKKEDIQVSKLEMEGLPDSMVAMAIEQQKTEMSKNDIKITDVSISGNIMTGKMQGQDITLNKIQ